MTVELELLESEEVEIMSDGVSGNIGGKLTGYIFVHLLEKKSGHVFNADTDFVIGKTAEGVDIKRRPDVAYCSFQTLPKVPRSAIPVPPDLAVEITSSRDEIDPTYKKVNEYRSIPIKLVWIINPEAKLVEVFVDGEPKALLGLQDVLKGEPVLPGFALPVKQLFEDWQSE